MDRKWAQAVGQRLPTHVERTMEREEWRLRMRMRIEEGGEMLRLIDEVVVYRLMMMLRLIDEVVVCRLMMMMTEGGLSGAELT